MDRYPVFFGISRPTSFDRTQIALRVVILVVLSIFGMTMGAVSWLLYLVLPVLAAILLSRDGPERFVTGGSARLARGLRWIMGAYAYMALLTDRIPSNETEDGVRLDLEPDAWPGAPSGAHPSVRSALLRIVYGFPSAFVFCILAIALWFTWIAAALLVLLTGSYPAALYDFQCGVLRWLARLFAYQGSMVEAYPPFSLDVGSFAHASHDSLAHD